MGNRVFLHGSALEIRLPGTPVDLRPFLELCSATNDTQAYFNQLKSTGFDEIRLKKPIPVKCLALIQFTEGRHKDTVSGVVVRNPYFLKRPEFPVSKLDHSLFFLLGSSEYLLCHLSDWLDVGDEVDQYYLTRLEGTWTGDIPVFRPVCTWGEIVRESPVSYRRGKTLTDLVREEARSERIRKAVESRARGAAKRHGKKKGTKGKH